MDNKIEVVWKGCTVKATVYLKALNSIYDLPEYTVQISNSRGKILQDNNYCELDSFHNRLETEIGKSIPKEWTTKMNTFKREWNAHQRNAKPHIDVPVNKTKRRRKLRVITASRD